MTDYKNKNVEPLRCVNILIFNHVLVIVFDSFDKIVAISFLNRTSSGVVPSERISLHDCLCFAFVTTCIVWMSVTSAICLFLFFVRRYEILLFLFLYQPLPNAFISR